MKLELIFFDALCETKVFKVNDVKATWEDFGEKYDRSPETAEDYGCGDMQFTGKPISHKVLERYHINKLEYYIIVDALKQGLSFGECGWCV